VPFVWFLNRLWNLEKQNRRTADALERIAKSLEAKPLKLDDVVELDQRL
jgi:exonuclease VII small subunit